MGTRSLVEQRAGGMGDAEYELEIDLTTDAPDGLVPIRWVGPDDREPVPAIRFHSNGNGAHAEQHHNGSSSNGHASPVRAVVVPACPGPRVASLASFIPPAWPVPRAAPDAQVIELLEPDDWYDVPDSVTLGRVMASRGARFLAVVAVVTVVALFAAVVLLWQRVEGPHRPVTSTQDVNAVSPAELVAVENRLNSIETKLSSLVDTNGVVPTGPEADILAFQIASLKSCVNSFQAAIDAGSVRGGQFAYC